MAIGWLLPMAVCSPLATPGSWGDGRSRLSEPIVGMAATPDGRGYWLVASDGGVFTFGDAGFFGSTAGSADRNPVVGLYSNLGGHGYSVVDSAGRCTTFGT